MKNNFNWRLFKISSRITWKPSSSNLWVFTLEFPNFASQICEITRNFKKIRTKTDNNPVGKKVNSKYRSICCYYSLSLLSLSCLHLFHIMYCIRLLSRKCAIKLSASAFTYIPRFLILLKVKTFVLLAVGFYDIPSHDNSAHAGRSISEFANFPESVTVKERRKSDVEASQTMFELWPM